MAQEFDLINENDNAVKLARYAQLAGYSEAQFFGINNPATVMAACQPIWTYEMRARLAKYLKEAQDEIELVTNYPLTPRWIADEPHPYSFPVHSKYGKVIQAGVKATTTIQAGTSLSFAADPATVTVATTVTDSSEIFIYHPGTGVEIVPSEITISGGNATIKIPWARLVKLAFQNNPEDGHAYAVVPPTAGTVYEAAVDVKRIYNDPATQGGLIWFHVASADCSCDCAWCNGTCGDFSLTGCIYLRNAEQGAFDVLPASFTAENGWVADCLTCYCSRPDRVHLNYKAGLTPLSFQAEDAIVRLAHAKMPQAPCGCGTIQEMWTRDRHTPEVLDAKRLDCPFGMSDGAWQAWQFAKAIALWRSVLV